MVNKCVILSRMFYSERERSNISLNSQLEDAKEVLGSVIHIPLTTHQQDALLCLLSDILGGFCSSLGSDFPDSMLVRCLNRNMFQIAAAEFFSFCYKNGQIDQKQWKKRQYESGLFLTGTLQIP